MNKYIATLFPLFIFLAFPVSARENRNDHFTKPSATAVSPYYFGYGSNLSYEFLKARLKRGDPDGPIPVDLGTFILRDYEFSYTVDVEFFGEKGVAANVTPKKGSKVYGVVYQLSQDQLAALDKSEHVPEAYTRIAVKVHRSVQQIFDCYCPPKSLIAWVYVGNPQHVTSQEEPDPAYVTLLVRSAKECGIPRRYIKKYLQYKEPCSSVR